MLEEYLKALFCQYCNAREIKNINFAEMKDNEDFINWIVQNRQTSKMYKDYLSYLNVSLYDGTEVDSSKLSKEKIDKLKYLLIDSGLTDSIQTFEESLPIDIEKAIIEDNYNSQILNTLLNGLNGEEVELIRKRFGIGEYRCHTLEEVAKQINVTRERVRQREIKTLSKLRRIAARKKVRY